MSMSVAPAGHGTSAIGPNCCVDYSHNDMRCGPLLRATRGWRSNRLDPVGVDDKARVRNHRTRGRLVGRGHGDERCLKMCPRVPKKWNQCERTLSELAQLRRRGTQRTLLKHTKVLPVPVGAVKPRSICWVLATTQPRFMLLHSSACEDVRAEKRIR